MPAKVRFDVIPPHAKGFRQVCRGQRVRAEHVDREFKTRTVEGTVEDIDEYGGVTIVLSKGQYFEVRGDIRTEIYREGDQYYIPANDVSDPNFEILDQN